MFDGIQDAFVIIDGILIDGKDVEDHDKILKQVIDRATEYNLTSARLGNQVYLT
ncbi:hypothetical protein DPMN_109611 [Dreissena polymorpha]|uniref:Reverse transcriptase n=1 Tax=Dreissena polymorpha TaxID=45954 RepID=A0A9D4KAW4_DREPO|nr:hypothetical protein DPMN_109611 [Dreissena polymorpha]